MITLLIGHRGVGKTSLLRRIEKYLKHSNITKGQFLDLDQEIQDQTGKSISDIFENKGENFFRKKEQEVLQKLLDKAPDSSFISLGAGFQFTENFVKAKKNYKVKILWVRRVSDSYGRIFFDRPKLSEGLSAKEDFLSRYEQRQSYYQKHCDQQLILREGVIDYDHGEYQFFSKGYNESTGYLTLTSQSREDMLNLPCEKFELRDDLLSEGDINRFDELLPQEKVLYSHRKSKKTLHKTSTQTIDCPLELGPPQIENPSIISLHDRNAHESLSECMQRLEPFEKNKQLQLKFAPEINSWDELKTGFEWQLKSPQTRSFLPRSKDGRWKWFRLFMKHKMPINFWRMNDGSAKDQPTLLDWLNAPQSFSQFAAILGNPTEHSFTPTEHWSFFFEMGMPVLNINISEDEFSEAFCFLKKLGLKAAAVTSPLKKKAFHVSGDTTEQASKLKSANTLYIDENGRTLAHNTDLAGFKTMISEIDLQAPVAIWGGGGTLEMLKTALPDAIPYSARTGRPRGESQSVSPQTVVFATSDPLPPDAWQPKTIVDLNYTLNSAARELSIIKNCEYYSGLSMFRAQASEQRDFWLKCFKNEDKNKL